MSDDDSLDEYQLVQNVRAGDKQAFGTLVQQYQDRLYNTLVRVLGSREDASDVLQDAFVQAYVKLDSFRGKSRFYTWLYRIALNLALSHRRRRKPMTSVEEAKEKVGEQPMDQQQAPDSQMIASEQIAAVQAALLKLGEQHRQILVLREMEDCSYETIGEILDLPVGTVRSRLFRARVQLKNELHALLPNEVDHT